jgi:hypothetical protein
MFHLSVIVCQEIGEIASALFYSKTNWMHNFSSLLDVTLRVSDSLSVQHQESKTVHTASGICHTGSVVAC